MRPIVGMFMFFVGCIQVDLPDNPLARDDDGDGYSEFEGDCDDRNPEATFLDGDRDCDGVKTVDDCDDGNPNSTIVFTDGDCDSILTIADCDDSDPSTVNDMDCDGVVTTEDCDDGDSLAWDSASGASSALLLLVRPSWMMDIALEMERTGLTLMVQVRLKCIAI